MLERDTRGRSGIAHHVPGINSLVPEGGWHTISTLVTADPPDERHARLRATIFDRSSKRASSNSAQTGGDSGSYAVTGTTWIRP